MKTFKQFLNNSEVTKESVDTKLDKLTEAFTNPPTNPNEGGFPSQDPPSYIKAVEKWKDNQLKELDKAADRYIKLINNYTKFMRVHKEDIFPSAFYKRLIDFAEYYDRLYNYCRDKNIPTR